MKADKKIFKSTLLSAFFVEFCIYADCSIEVFESKEGRFSMEQR